jgi:DNA-3-methyladenine glycosylase
MTTASKQLPRAFFARDALLVARELIGARLVRIENGRRIAGIINEAEAYIHEDDLGCHAKAGLTPRTRVMYGPPGYTYVYFTYGMHWLLNFVVEPEGLPAAVLIRGIVPVEGLEVIAARRDGQPPKSWTDGPGKITRAMAIDGSLNGLDACSPGSTLFVEEGLQIPDPTVTKTPRVGLNNVPEPWKSIPWRFWVPGERIITPKE